MTADVLHYDPDTQTAYRITAKTMTVRDGIRLGELEDQIAARDSLEGRALLALAQHYPLLVCGTRSAERAALTEAPPTDADGSPVLPADLSWQPFALTEDGFLDLPDWLMWAWYTAVIGKNPQYDRSYEVLKKNIRRMMSARPSAAGSSTAAPDASASVSTS